MMVKLTRSIAHISDGRHRLKAHRGSANSTRLPGAPHRRSDEIAAGPEVAFHV